MPDSHAYRHVQTYTTLWVILLASAGFGGYMISLDATTGSGESLLGLLVLVSSLGGGLLVLGRLVITVHARELRWHFGYVGWPGWSVTLAEIIRLEPVHASFALGSGIRGPAQHRLYNVTMGGPALRLHLRDGRTVTLGTPEPARLAGFIEPRLPAAHR
jgi:hypothetical protein